MLDTLYTQPKVRFRPGPVGPWDSAGKPYVTLVQYGVKNEGDGYASREKSEDEAWSRYFTTLRDYLAANSAKTVEWRRQPHVEWTDDHTECVIRSRLSVVEKFHG